MKTITFTRTTTRYYSLYRGKVITVQNDWQGSIYGRKVVMCHDDFASYFALGGKKSCTLVFTKTKHPDAYPMNMGECTYLRGGFHVPLVGLYEPRFMREASRAFKHLYREGYNYVRCEVEA